MAPPIETRFLRSLDFSAASGLVYLDETFFAVADDELSLFKFNLDGSRPSEKISLFPGNLPEDLKSRKAKKPDLESLLFLPELNAMLAMPSGSRPNRMRGALASLDGTSVEIDFGELYVHLLTLNPDLNIEGAVATENDICLFQRGNGGSQRNQIFKLSRKIIFDQLSTSRILSENSFLQQKDCDLGQIQGHPLGFTDACYESEGQIWFIAAAEASQSTYDDGAYIGAEMGCLDAKGEIIIQARLQIPAKPEGLTIDITRRKFFIVTDPDDRTKPAGLFEGDLPIL